MGVRRDRKPMHTTDAEGDVTMLREPVQMDLNLNDLRMMVNCMKAVEYQGKIDDEPYLDDEALELKKRLEGTYERTLEGLSVQGKSHVS
jgi:hypothetical protein